MQKRIQNAQDDGAGDEDLSTEDQDNFDSEVSQWNCCKAVNVISH